MRKYTVGKSANELRSHVKKLDPRAAIRSGSGSLSISTDMHVHREAVAAVFASREKSQAPSDDVTFNLKPMTTSAENAFRQFASMAGKQCEITESASEACRNQVTIQAEAMTVRQLVEMVAKMAGVKMQWNDASIVISK